MFATTHPARLTGAVCAALLSVIAMTVEMTTRICAETIFDPLPDVFAFAAYAWIPVTLLFNGWLLRRNGDDTPERLRVLHGAAYAATIIAICVAALYTLMFLTVLPVSIFAIMMMGIGLCAWSPALNLIVLPLQLAALGNRRREAQIVLPRSWKTGAGLAGAIVAIGLSIVPYMTGNAVFQAINEPAHRNAAVTRLRLLHAEDALLADAGIRHPSFWFELGAGQSPWIFESSEEPTSKGAITADAVYYLVTGRAASTAAPPSGRRAALDTAADDDAWEQNMAVDETGGERVGHRARGLRLAASDLTGTLTPDRESASCEWTLEFRNDGDEVQEARADILLPEGGVIDHASLWIGGVERPAAFGSTETARKAYQKVAVVEQRDPLLVTATSPGRVLAQCFPIPAHGSMKIRLGMTAPLRWRDPAAPALVFTPPILADANFRIDRSLQHSMSLTGIWAQARGRLQGAPGWRIEERGDSHTATLLLDARRTRTPPALTIAGGPTPQRGDKIGSDRIRRESPFAPPASPVDLLVLIDPTARVGEAFDLQRRQNLTGALAALPAGSRYQLADARGPQNSTTGWMPTVAPLSPEASWWSERQYVGGLDSTRALQWACDTAKAAPHASAVLWLHDAKPDGVCDTDALKAADNASIHHITLVGVCCGAGEDAVMEAVANDRGVYALSASDDNAMADRRPFGGARRDGDSRRGGFAARRP